jgi:hypothetical protein
MRSRSAGLLFICAVADGLVDSAKNPRAAGESVQGALATRSILDLHLLLAERPGSAGVPPAMSAVRRERASRQRPHRADYGTLSAIAA